MKIIKIKFLGREYEIQAENNQEEIAKEESMNVCAVNDCDGPCLPNLEYCLMHRKNKPTSVPKKSMIVGSIK